MKFTFLKNWQLNITQWFLCLAILAITCSVSLYLLHSKSNTIYYVKEYFSGRLAVGKDSWEPMSEALLAIKKHPDSLVYQELFFKKGIKFQYPLTSLLILDIPQTITQNSTGQIINSLNILSLISVFLTGLVAARLLISVLDQPEFKKTEGRTTFETLFIYVETILITLFFYPLVKSYVLGQVQTILTFLVALSILCWYGNKKKLTGLILGLVCLIKPQLGLLFIWGAIRKQYEMVITGISVIIVFSSISVYRYGFNNNIEYLKVLSFLSHHGESFYANQSINGLVNRMLFNGENLVWNNTFPPYSPIVYAFTLISSLILIGIGLLWNYKSKNPNLLDFCIIILSTTMASPIAWEHHYGVLLPILIVMPPFLIKYYGDKKWLFWLTAFVFIITSQYLVFFKLTANTHFNFLQSYLFFGALIVLLFLLKISRKTIKTLNSKNI